MLVVKIATEQDIPAIMQFSKLACGKLHSLPSDITSIEQKVSRSIRSVNNSINAPGNEYYFFVMEDLTAKAIVGCCAIKASVGLDVPYYLFHVSQIQQISQEFDFSRTYQLLELNTDFNGASEVCSLYLLPEYRKKYNGRLLSYARLMFIALFNERFSDRLFADMRGVSHGKSQPPFWRYLIKHFMPLSFAKADTLLGNEQRQFITDLIPKFPICTDLLSTAVRAVIGVAHPSTLAAKAMLEAEKFRYQHYVNVLDAGPSISVMTSDLRMLNESRLYTVVKIDKPSNKKIMHLLANNRLYFRVVHDHIDIEGNSVTISPVAARALQIEIGDKVLCRNIYSPHMGLRDV